MDKFTITTFVCVAVIVSVVNCEIFSSTTRLTQLPKTARLVLDNLQKYIQQTEEKLVHTRKYLEKLYLYTDDTITSNSSKRVNEVVENPIMAFQLIKLLSSDLNVVRSIAELDHWKPIAKFVENSSQTLMPNEDDVKGAAKALIRLQETYYFNIRDMSQGLISDIKSVANLTVSDLHLLGEVSFDKNHYAQAIIWLQYARRKAIQEGNHTSLLKELEDSLSNMIKTHNTKLVNGSDFKHLTLVPEYDETFGYPVSYKNKNTAESFICKRTAFSSLLSGDVKSYENYKTLCRGENYMKTKPSRQLICRLETRRHPSLLIQPLKVEQKNLELPIVQFHDVLTDSQIEKIKQLAQPDMHRSTVVNATGDSALDEGRISQNSWLSDANSPFMAQVYKLTEIITGLLTNDAESAQIANYGLGGYYGVHPDYFGKKLGLLDADDALDGDRIATLMFYLSDVEAGGATVFPKIGAAVYPKKGSAVFWYNMKKNGQENPKSKHAGCPVVKGNKWIMNIWIRSNEQMFRRPCSLIPDV